MEVASSRLLLLSLAAGLVAAQGGPTLIAGDARGSDSVTHVSIDFNGHPTEAALSPTPDVETAGTSQPLGVPTDVQRTIYSRDGPGGPHKTCSVMNVCTCATSESGDAGLDCNDNKWSEFSPERGAAHAWPAAIRATRIAKATLQAADPFSTTFSTSSDCADCDCGSASSSDLAEDEKGELDRAGQAPGDPCCTRHAAAPRTHRLAASLDLLTARAAPCQPTHASWPPQVGKSHRDWLLPARPAEVCATRMAESIVLLSVSSGCTADGQADDRLNEYSPTLPSPSPPPPRSSTVWASREDALLLSVLLSSVASGQRGGVRLPLLLLLAPAFPGATAQPQPSPPPPPGEGDEAGSGEGGSGSPPPPSASPSQPPPSVSHSQPPPSASPSPPPPSASPSSPPALSIYVYNLPREVSFGLDDPPAKAKDYEVYRGGYAQYATELVVPKLVRQSRFAAATPEEADLFLVPFQGLARFYGEYPFMRGGGGGEGRGSAQRRAP